MMDTINKINNHNTKSNSHSEQSSQVLIGRLNNRIGDLQAQLIVCREECSELKQRTNEYVVEVEHIHKDKAKAKNKIQQMYNELQTLIRQKQRMQQENRGYRAQTQEMQKQISKLSNEVEQVREGSKRKQMMNGKQMEQRVRQIGQLRSYNQKMLKERREVKELRVANERLEKEKEFINRQTKQLNNKVDHLWSIKEVEYQNINQIVYQLKQN